ncbi:MAG: hypothetical protein AAGC96_08230 [Pseudomonadota bacterium]
MQIAASTLTGLVKRQWLPIFGAVFTLVILALGPVLAVPFQAFLDFCFGEATDDTEMSAGLLMWFTMRPEWSVITLGISLVSIGILIKSIAIDSPKPPKAGTAHKPQQVKPVAEDKTRRTRTNVAVWPVPSKNLNKNTSYAAMIWAAEVTGGITSEQLATMFKTLTGMEAPEWGHGIALTKQARPHPAMVVILDKVQEKSDQRTVMALVLAVCFTRRKLSEQATQLVWLLATKFRMTKAEVQELHEVVRSGTKVSQPFQNNHDRSGRLRKNTDRLDGVNAPPDANLIDNGNRTRFHSSFQHKCNTLVRKRVGE